MVFEQTGKILPGYSKGTEEYFGKNLEGKMLEEALGIPENLHVNIQSWREILFSDLMPFADGASLGPSSYEKLDGRYIELSYRPIRENEKLVRVILMATDKTKELELQHKAKLEREKVELITKMVENIDAFQDFIVDSKTMIEQMRKTLRSENLRIDEMDFLFRMAHTIKGNASMFGVFALKNKAHVLESNMADIKTLSPEQWKSKVGEIETGVKEMEMAIDKTLSENKQILGESNSENDHMKKITVPVIRLTQLENALSEKFPKDSYVFKTFMDVIILEPLLPSLKKFESVVVSLAEKKEKWVKPIVWKGESIKVRLEVYRKLLASMVHAFRNAVDHGIESPDVREEKGKDASGTIQVTLSQVSEREDMIMISIKDDGNGINVEKLSQKALALQLISQEEVQRKSYHELCQLIFLNGLSSVEEVTDVSGRGVGMDAIRYEAKRLGGKVWVESNLGQGTELFLQVPRFAEKSDFLE